MSSRSCLRLSQRASRSFAASSCTRSQTSSRAFSQFAAKDAQPRICVGQKSSLSWRRTPGASRIRGFASSSAFQHGHLQAPKPGEERHVTFIDKEGDEHKYTVADGDNLLDIAQANDLEMEGACGGSCACSTCHVIVDQQDFYDKMEEPDDDENDMLDLAFGLTETSRLGCQVKMSKDLDGLVVRLPSMTRNLQASDFVERKKEGG